MILVEPGSLYQAEINIEPEGNSYTARLCFTQPDYAELFQTALLCSFPSVEEAELAARAFHGDLVTFARSAIDRYIRQSAQ